MLDLAILLYVFDVLAYIDYISGVTLFLLFVSSVIAPAFFIIGQGFCKAVLTYVKPYTKRIIVVVSVILAINILIPKKQTMYIIAGLYVGDKVLTHASNSQTFQKAEKLLNQKLDEILAETKQEKDND